MNAELTLAASQWLTEACGSYPDSISYDDGLYSFETKLERLAMDAFPIDEGEGFLFELIRTEISGDEDGWYVEAVLYCSAPDADRPGSIVEGLYNRKIETEPGIEAEFHGTLRFTAADTHRKYVEQAEQAHFMRTRDQLKSELEHYLGAYARTVSKIKDPGPDPDFERQIINALRTIAIRKAPNG